MDICHLTVCVKKQINRKWEMTVYIVIKTNMTGTNGARNVSKMYCPLTADTVIDHVTVRLLFQYQGCDTHVHVSYS